MKYSFASILRDAEFCYSMESKYESHVVRAGLDISPNVLLSRKKSRENILKIETNGLKISTNQ